MGIAMCPDRGKSMDKALKAADTALWSMYSVHRFFPILILLFHTHIMQVDPAVGTGFPAFHPFRNTVNVLWNPQVDIG